MLNQTRSLWHRFLLLSNQRRLRGASRRRQAISKRRRSFLESLETRAMLTVPGIDSFPPGFGELEQATASLSPQGDLLIFGAQSAEYNNQFLIRIDDGDNFLITDWRVPFANVGAIPGATLSDDKHTLTVPHASVTSHRIRVYGGGGDDTLTVDQSNGNPVPMGGIVYLGGDQTSEFGDAMVLTGGEIDTVNYFFVNDNDGSVDIDGQLITYYGLEPITDNMNAANRVFTFTGGAETISITDSGGANGLTRIDSTLGEFVDFAVPTASLTVIANGGDTATITAFDAAFNTPLISFQGTTSANTFNLGAANVIPDASALSLTGNVNFSLNGFSETVASLASTDAIPTVALTAGNTLTAGNASNTTFSGIITGAGNLTKVGTGTLVLSGANTYSGQTTISAGILNANSSAAIGDGSATNTLVLNGGRFQAAAALVSPATRGVVLNGTSTSTIDTNNVALTIQGVISGGSNGVDSLTVVSTAGNAAANLILLGNNTFAGNLRINRGTVSVQHGNALGASGAGNATIVTGADGTANVPRLLLNAAAAITIPETLSINANAAGRVTLEANSAAVHTLTGPIDVSSTGNIVQFTSANSTGGMTINGDISGTMSAATVVLLLRGGSTSTTNFVNGSLNLVGGGLTKTDAGLWRIGNATKSYSWASLTNVAAGTLRMAAANVLPAANDLQIGQSTNAANAILDLAGFSQTTTNVTYQLAGSTTTVNGQITTGAGTLTMNGNLTFNTDAGYTATTSVISGNLNLGGSTRTFTINDSPDSAVELTISAIISNGGMTKTGPGLIVLSGVSTYSGPTTVTGGTLVVNGSIAASATTVQTGTTLTGSGTTGPLTIDAGGTHSPGTPIGRMTVTGNYVENGALPMQIASPSGIIAGTDYDQVRVLGSGSVTIGAGATLTVTYTGAAGTFLPAAGQVYVLIDNDGNNPAETVGTFAGLAEGATVTLDGINLTISYIGGDGNDVVLIAPGVAITALYVDASFTGSGTVDGDLETAGMQSATIGTTAFASIAAALAAYPAYSGPIIVNGGTYASAVLTGGGSVSLRLVQDLVNNELNVTINDLSGDAADDIVIRFNNGTNANLTVNQGSFSGVISGVGNLTKNTAATLTLTGANTYSGQTTISGGILSANSSAAIGDGSATNTLILNGGTLQAGAAIPSPATRGVVLNGASTSTIDTNNVAVTIAGVISGGANAVNSLTVVSTAGATGNLVLQGNNTFAGNVILNRGTISVQSANALGLSGAGNVTTVNGADATTNVPRLLLNAASAITIPESLNMNASAAGRVTLEANSAAIHTLTGPIDVTSTGNLVQFTSSNSTGAMTINGDITGTLSAGVLLFVRGGSTNANNILAGSVNLVGGDGLAKTDAGLWRVGNATKTYSWDTRTNVAAGTLRMASANVLPPAIDLQIGQNTNAANAILDLAGFNQTTTNISYNLAGSATTANGQITTGAAGALTMNGDLTFNTDAGYTATTSIISGNLNLGGGTRTFTISDSPDTVIELTISAIIANGGLTKAGPGLLVLSGVSTYTGATTVTGGILVVAGSIVGSVTTVQSGAALAGNGTTGLVTVDAGGIHAPGIPLGMMTVTGNYVENGALQIEIATPSGNVAGTDYDQVRVVGNGSVTIGAGATLSVAYNGTPGTFNPGPGQTYILIDNDGNNPADTLGTFAGLAQGATVTIDGQAMTISYIGGDGNDVVLTAPGGTVTTIYVNDQFTGSGTVDGDLETAGMQTATIGTDAFASVAAALAAYPTFNGTIVVNGGTYASALLAGGGAVTLRLVQDLTNNELDVTFNDLSGDAADGIVTRYNNAANANLIVAQGSFSGVISGIGNLTKTTAGTLNLLGANTYTGVTSFSGGIVNAATITDYGVAGALGARLAAQETATGDGMGWVFRGGTLQYTGATPQSTNRQIRVQTTGGTIDASGSVAAATLSFTYNAANTNWFDTPGARTLTLTGTNTGVNTFAHLITDQATSPTNVTKAGAGTWFLTNNASTYTGITGINGGVLNASTITDYGVPSALGARTAAQETATGDGIGFVFRNGGTLQYTGATPQSTNRQIRVQTTGGAINASGSVPTATLSFTYNTTNTNWFDTAGQRTFTLTGTNTGANTFSHLITDQATNPTNLTKSGTGTWILNNNASTYTGITGINGGVLNATSITNYGVPSSLGARTAAQETATGDGIGFVFRNGGTLQYTGATAQSTNRQIRVQTTGGGIDASGSLPAATLSFTYNTTNTNWFDTAGQRTLILTGSNTGANTFAHLITDQATNPTNLTKRGTGTWFVTNPASTYTGITAFEGGIMNGAVIADSGVVSSFGARAAAQETATGDGIGFVFRGGVMQYTGATPMSTNRQIRVQTTGGTIDASGSVPAATLSFTFSGANTNWFDTPGTRTFTLTGTNTGANTFAHQITNQAASATSVAKTAAGTWVLSNTSPYTGTTNVVGGTLNLTGSIAASVTTVQSGATLTGTGTSGVLTVNASGTHAPGTNVGTTTVTGNYVENGALQIQIGSPAGSVPGTDYDQVRVVGSGSVAIGAAATLAVTYTGAPGTFNPAGSQVYVIIDNDGTNPADTMGTFAGLPAGATVTVDGKAMTIQYNGGDGNDVVLVAPVAVAALYVNDQFTAPNGTVVDGDLEAAGMQSATIGTTAFASVAAALAFNPTYTGIIVVNGGMYASASLAGGGNVTLRLVQDLANNELNVTFNSLSGDATDAIVTRYLNAANANLIVTSGSFAGVISGSGDVLKNTAGTVTLSGVNTYSGLTTVASGILSITNAAALGTAAGATSVTSGAQLQLSGGITVTGEQITINGTGGNSQGALNNLSGNNTWAGPIVVGATGTNNRVGSTAGNLTLSGVISGGQAGSMGGLTVRNGAGVTIVTGGSNTYLGDTTVVVGTLRIAGGDNRLPIGTKLAIGNTASVTPAQFDLNGFNQTVGGLYSIDSTMVIEVTNSGALSTLTVNLPTGTDTYNGIITGAVNLTKTGAGVLALGSAGGNGSNTFTGTALVSAGRLHLNKTPGQNAIPGTLNITTGGLVSFGGNNQIADTASVNVSGAGSVFNGTGFNAGQPANLQETIANLTVTGGTFQTGSSSTWNITGTGSFTGGAGNTIFLGNSGTTIAFGALSLTGMTATPGGTVQTNNSFAIYGGGPAVGTITVGGLTLNGSVLNLRQGSAGSRLVLNGNVTATGTASLIVDPGSGSGGIAQVELSGTAAAANRTVDVNAGATLTVSAPIANGAATPGSLTKLGTGTLVLSGANTYSGTTAVNAGTAQLAGGSAIADTAGAVSVGLGATLQLLASETISSYVGAGDIGPGTNDSTLNLGGFTLTTTGSAALANVTTTTGGAIVAGTSITDADDDSNITGPNIVLQAATGIGTLANPLETTVANLEASGGTGGVFLANTGNLIIGGVSALVGVSATGAGINVSATGSLTINENVTGAGAGTSVTLSTIDAATAGQDLLLAAAATVSSAASSVTLNAGDNATLTGNLTSGTTTTVNIDATNADALGGTLTLTGSIVAPGGAFLNGDTNDDTFTVRPQASAAVTVDGKAPFLTATGDVLNLDLSTATGQALTLGSIGSGVWTFNAPLQSVNYVSIEVMNANAPFHLALDANTAAFGNTGVPDEITVRQSGPNLIVERTGASIAPDNDDIGILFQVAIASILSFTYTGSSDNDIVTISDVGGLPQFAGTAPGVPDNTNLAGLASILFNGNGGADSLVFNLTGPNAAQAYAIGNGTGAAGLEGEVQSSSGGLSLQTYFVDVEATLRIGTGASPGALQIIGDSSSNQIAITPTGATTTITATGYAPFVFSGNNYSQVSVSGLGGADLLELVGFGTAQTNNPAVNLSGGLGDDTLQVHSTSGNTGPVTLIGDAGNDLFVLTSSTNTVDGIVGPVIVDGSDGLVASNDDQLVIIDSGDTTGDSILISAVNPATSADYRVEGITSTPGNDVIFRNIDTLTYTGTSSNDIIDAQFGSTTPMHDLSVVTLNGWTGGDQFLLFTSDQIGGTAPTPSGVASGLAIINLNGDAPGNPNGTDGNDLFGQTPPGIVGPGAGNAGLLVPDTVRLIRPSASTAINLNGGQPSAPVGASGDSVGDVLNLDITSLPTSSGLVLATAAGVLASTGLQPLTYAQIEDLNVVSGGALLNLQMGDTLVRGAAGPDMIIFSQINVPGNPNNTRVRLNTLFVDFPMTGKTLTFAGDSNDYLTHANVTFPMESHGEGGDDYIAGGMGNDLLVGGLGNDQINASGGDNIVIGDEMLSGTTLPQDSDVGGNDMLSALGGNDVFYGGGGHDQVSAGAGNDYVYGGAGDDILDGNLGDDRIYGGAGNDILSGSAGNDLLSGGDGNDLLLGLDGNDVLIGGNGVDSLNGGSGDDLLISGSVANELSSWTSAPNTTTFDAGLYARATDNDAALMLLLTQWSSTGNRSSLAAILDDGVLDSVWGDTGNDHFSTTPGEAQDFNATGMGTDELF